MNNDKGITSPRYITRRQEVKPAKIKISRQLRRDMTDSEKKLWQHLRANKLNGLHFRRQQIIDGFIVDFYCDKPQLVIEIDGEFGERMGGGHYVFSLELAACRTGCHERSV